MLDAGVVAGAVRPRDGLDAGRGGAVCSMRGWRRADAGPRRGERQHELGAAQRDYDGATTERNTVMTARLSNLGSAWVRRAFVPIGTAWHGSAVFIQKQLSI